MMNDQFAGGAVELSKPPPSECPRCGSINTKFCYYNNYNKSQPRHFCKRHWTKGGTLRNIPAGRLKRPRTSKQKHDFENLFSLSADQKNVSNILYDALILSSTSSLPQFTILESNGTTLTHTEGLNVSVSAPQNHPNTEFTFSSFTSLISNPASDYCQSSSDYDVECRPAVNSNDLWSWNDQIDLLGIDTVWGNLTFP